MSSAVQAPARASVPRLVLLVEDDGDRRDQLGEGLRSGGCEVVELHDGFELLDYFRAAASEYPGTLPDVVVAELLLPGCGGMEACAQIHGFGAQVPVILLAPDRALDVEREAEAAGAAFVFGQPVDLDGLRRAVSSVSGGTP